MNHILRLNELIVMDRLHRKLRGCLKIIFPAGRGLDTKVLLQVSMSILTQKK